MEINHDFLAMFYSMNGYATVTLDDGVYLFFPDEDRHIPESLRKPIKTFKEESRHEELRPVHVTQRDDKGNIVEHVHGKALAIRFIAQRMQANKEFMSTVQTFTTEDQKDKGGASTDVSATPLAEPKINPQQQ